MATLSGSVTIADVAKTLAPDGSVAMVAELLEQTNGILQDIPWMESNLPTGHQSTVRTSLPSPSWRTANAGTSPSKGSTAQIMDTIGWLESWSEVDKNIAELNGNTAKFRMLQAKAHIEAMGQEVAQTLFYGNAGTAPNEFNGFAVRYNSLTGATADNVITGGGTGSDQASIYLVRWTPDGVNGIYPKGSIGGLIHKDMGEQVITTTAGVGSAGARMMGYLDHFQWQCGLAVADWRNVVRICNIDTTNLSGGSAADLPELMIKAIERLPSTEGGKLCFYMNRTVRQYLRLQLRNDVQTGGQLGYSDVSGRVVREFDGIQIRIVDQLLNTESQVS